MTVGAAHEPVVTAKSDGEKPVAMAFHPCIHELLGVGKSYSQITAIGRNCGDNPSLESVEAGAGISDAQTFGFTLDAKRMGEMVRREGFPKD